LKSWTSDEVTSRADYEALGLHNIENNIMAKANSEQMSNNC